MLYLAFYTGKGGLLSRIIRWRTNGECSHVELVLDRKSGLCFSAQYGEGVRYKTIPDLENPAEWDLIPLARVDTKAIRAEVEKLAGSDLKYDMRGILRFFAGKRATDETRWFCSEVCCHVAQIGGAFQWVDDSGVSPERLRNMAKAREEAYGSRNHRDRRGASAVSR